MEYRVIKKQDIELSEAIKAIEEEVNRLISEGWKPIGGIIIVERSEYSYAIQTTVKE